MTGNFKPICQLYDKNWRIGNSKASFLHSSGRSWSEQNNAWRRHIFLTNQRGIIIAISMPVARQRLVLGVILLLDCFNAGLCTECQATGAVKKTLVAATKLNQYDFQTCQQLNAASYVTSFLNRCSFSLVLSGGATQLQCTSRCMRESRCIAFSYAAETGCSIGVETSSAGNGNNYALRSTGVVVEGFERLLNGKLLFGSLFTFYDHQKYWCTTSRYM